MWRETCRMVYFSVPPHRASARRGDDVEDVAERRTAVAPPPRGSVVARTVTEEAQSYNSSVAGIDIEAVRAGVGVGPTQVMAAIGDRFT
jgi:hypothetical protein